MNGFAIRGTKQTKKNKRGQEFYKYYSDKEKCRNCPFREDCIKKSKTIGRVLTVGINTAEFYGYSQEQKTEEFQEKYKKRACQEWENGEMKNFHGLDRARGYGLKSMSTQAKLTALAVNLKRIAHILSSFTPFLFHFFTKLFIKIEYIINILIIRRCISVV